MEYVAGTRDAQILKDSFGLTPLCLNAVHNAVTARCSQVPVISMPHELFRLLRASTIHQHIRQKTPKSLS